MKLTLRRSVAAFAAVLLGIGGLVALSTPAQAATVVPWGSDDHAVAGLTFYDAAGTQVTSGNITDAPFAKYVQADGPVRAGDTKATLFGATPVTGTQPFGWSGAPLSASIAFPVATAPAPIAASSYPTVALTADDTTIAQYATDLPNSASSGAYQGLYTIRIKTSKPGDGTGPNWAAATIKVTGSTWTRVIGETTTALSVSPSGSAVVGSSVTLNARVTNVAGSVQFYDGATPLGSAVTAAAGLASTSTSALTVGNHQLTATFTPSDSVTYGNSTSAVTPLQISPTTTSTALAVSPNGGSQGAETVTLTATVTPSAAAGTVQFLDGSTPIGATVAVTAGTASKTTATLSGGTHALKALFIPTDSNAYAGSTSTSTTHVVTIPTTTTALAVAPVGTTNLGDTVTLTATVTPSAVVGAVQFFDGVTALGSPVAVASGTASTTTTALTAGAHSLKATFTATNPLAYGASTSAVVAHAVNAPTTTTLTASPSSAYHGAKVTFTANVTPSNAVGFVQFKDGATVVKTVTLSGGKAVFATTTLTNKTHAVTATFVPSTSAFLTSTSAAKSVTVKTRSTSTSISLSKSSVKKGKSVTVTAKVGPSTAAGSIKFYDGTKLVKTVKVVKGKAKFSKKFSKGKHKLKAVYVPKNSQDTKTSKSGVKTLKVTK